MQDDFIKTGDNMETMLIELIAVLEKQADLYRSLLDILLNEKKAVVFAKLDAVNAARFQKEAVLLLIHAGDEKRKDVVKRISDHLGCPSRDLTLKLLAHRVEVPFSLKLLQCAADISSLVQDIQHENEMNKSLITHTLKLIRSSINLIVQLMTPPPVYFRTGKMVQGEVCGTVLSSSV
jgi:flagellar biosynthesis/type III secretory pathway chaperone